MLLNEFAKVSFLIKGSLTKEEIVILIQYIFCLINIIRIIKKFKPHFLNILNIK